MRKRIVIDGLFLLLNFLFTTLVIFLIYQIIAFIFKNGTPVIYNHLRGISYNASLSLNYLLPLIVSTLILTIATIFIVVPLGVLAAVYLTEFAKNNFLTKLIRQCIQTLASIPSIIYGLFGMLIFVRMANFGLSLVAGSATMAIMLLPLIITQTENALKSVAINYKEASASLGATEFETIFRVVLPVAAPGIVVGVILAIGRTLSESAALIFTIGTFVRMPINRSSGFLSIFESGTSLTIRAFIEFKEYGNLEAATSIGVITLILMLVLNFISKVLSLKYQKK